MFIVTFVIALENTPNSIHISKKEDLQIITRSQSINVNIFVLLLSYSRFQVYRVSLSKTQDILFSFLDDAFETFGGVPDEIVTDNMKTVMDEARTKCSAGKVNNKFQQFADDYDFKVRPCIAGHPHTKAYVKINITKQFCEAVKHGIFIPADRIDHFS